MLCAQQETELQKGKVWQSRNLEEVLSKRLERDREGGASGKGNQSVQGQESSELKGWTQYLYRCLATVWVPMLGSESPDQTKTGSLMLNISLKEEESPN